VLTYRNSLHGTMVTVLLSLFLHLTNFSDVAPA